MFCSGGGVDDGNNHNRVNSSSSATLIHHQNHHQQQQQPSSFSISSSGHNNNGMTIRMNEYCFSPLSSRVSRNHRNLPDDDVVIIDKDDEEDIVAKELNQLSFQEREKVVEEIHGVGVGIPDETPLLIETSMKELEVEITKIPKPRRKWLDKALFLKPTLLKDPKQNLGLLFLRAERFQVAQAADRLCSHFEHKVLLFGKDKLVQDITLEDLNEYDLAAMKTGTFRMIHHYSNPNNNNNNNNNINKDQSGRPIFYTDLKHMKFHHWMNQIRYSWYQIMTLLQDNDNEKEQDVLQMNGCVNVLDATGLVEAHHGQLLQLQVLSELIFQGAPIIAKLPIRFSAMHFCYDDIRLKPIFTLLQLASGKQVRLHYRSHFGSTLEIRYALMTFGINIDTTEMDSRKAIHVVEQYIQERRHKEQQRQVEKEQQQQQQQQQQQLANETNNSTHHNTDNNKKKDNTNAHAALQSSSASVTCNTTTTTTTTTTTHWIEYPQPCDVLIGRGRPYQTFPGNIHLFQLENKYLERYKQSTERLEKTMITIGIIQHVQKDLGGRFLLRSSQGWEIAKEEVVREKIGQAMRMKARRMDFPTTATTSRSSRTSTTLMNDNDNNRDDSWSPQRMIQPQHLLQLPSSSISTISSSSSLLLLPLRTTTSTFSTSIIRPMIRWNDDVNNDNDNDNDNENDNDNNDSALSSAKRMRLK